jgi:cytochrome c oxidase cbb3-type subunit III
VNSPGLHWRQISPGFRRPWATLFLLVACAAGCDLPGRPKPGDRYASPQYEMSFSVLFRQNCAGCHGTDGTLGPAPPLHDKLFLALIPEVELQRIITEGRPGALMPAFAISKGGPLSAEQVTVLAEGIKRHWGAAAPAPRGAPPYLLQNRLPEGGRSGNRAEGVRAFARACASCHGENGRGGTWDGRPVGAINSSDFLALVSDQALRRYVITGRSDLGMPGYADATGRPQGFEALTESDVANLVALLAAWREGASDDRKGN